MGSFLELVWQNKTVTVGLVLSALGAWQTFSWILAGSKRVVTEVQRRMRNRHAHKGYYLRERVCEYRVAGPDGVFFSRRIDEVAPLDPMVSQVRLAYRWTGEGPVDPPKVNVLTPGIKARLEPDTGLHEGGKEWNAFALVFDPPLKRRGWRADSVRFESVHQIKPTKAPQPFYSTKTEKRLDRLVIRIAFPPTQLPKAVKFSIVNSFGQDLEPPTTLTVDPFSGLCEVVKLSVQPFARHRVSWD